MPILHGVGGRFRYDFEVSRVLNSECDSAMNRVFVIQFPSKNDMEHFFSDGAYLKAKEKFFVQSVGDAVIISEYNT